MAGICSECHNFSDGNPSHSAHKNVGLGVCDDMPSGGKFVFGSKTRECHIVKPVVIAVEKGDVIDLFHGF